MDECYVIVNEFIEMFAMFSAEKTQKIGIVLWSDTGENSDGKTCMVIFWEIHFLL